MSINNYFCNCIWNVCRYDENCQVLLGFRITCDYCVKDFQVTSTTVAEPFLYRDGVYTIFRAFASCLYSMDSTTTWDISFCFHLMNSIRKSIKRTKWVNTLFLLIPLSSAGYYHRCLESLEARHVLPKITQKTISVQMTWNSLNDRESGPHPWDWLSMSCMFPLVGIQLLSCYHWFQWYWKKSFYLLVFWEKVWLLQLSLQYCAGFCISLHLSLVYSILPYLASLVLYMEMWCWSYLSVLLTVPSLDAFLSYIVSLGAFFLVTGHIC